MTPRIIFFCPRALEPWGPPSLNQGGIGGSETAVVHIARHFSDAGWRVDVYNAPEQYEGVYSDAGWGVGYWDHSRLGADESCDLLVAWRDPNLIDLPVRARARVLWCHDLNSGPDVGPAMARFDRVLGVSQWHADYLRDQYGLTNTGYVPNGIELSRFAEPVRKTPWRVVYGSSPDRGLDRLLALWPEVVKAEPEATLHVAYGWENIDKRIASGDQGYAAFKDRIVRAIEALPSVTWRGRLGQDELARFYGEAWAWAYPTSFTEVSCITAMEAMAGGAVPVTSAVAALKETVGEGGLVVDGNTYGAAWRAFYVRVLQGVLGEANVRYSYERKARARAQSFTWERSFREHWLPAVTALLEQKEPEAVAS